MPVYHGGGIEGDGVQRDYVLNAHSLYATSRRSGENADIKLSAFLFYMSR